MNVNGHMKLVMWLLGTLSTISMMLAGFSLKWQFDANAKIEVMQERMSSDARQDETLKKHWKLHGWARDEINDIRVQSGLEPVRWPNL